MIKIQNKTKITLNNSKIIKQPLKNPKPSGICRNSVEEGFWVREQWRCVGSRAATDEGERTGGSGTSSFSLSPYADGDLQNNRKHNRLLILIFLSFWSRSVHSPLSLLLLRVYFTAGQFIMGFIFFSSASGGRSGGCRGGGGVEDLHSCWLPWRLGLLLEEEGAAARGVVHRCWMKKASRSGGVGSRWKRTGLASGCCSGRYCWGRG